MKTNFIVITKNGQETLISTLTSLVFQSFKNFKLIIYDNSNVNIFEYNPVRRLVAALTNEEIQTIYQRSIQKENVAKARFLALKLIDQDCEFVGFIDDDVLLSPNAIKEIIKCKEINRTTPFIQGCVMDSENVRNYDDYHLPIFNTTNYNQNKNKYKHQWQYAKWSSKMTVPIEPECCNTGFILFERKMLEDIKAFFDYETITYAEDNNLGIRLYSKYHKKPLLCTSAFAYHIPRGQRRWDTQVIDKQFNALYKKLYY